MTKFRNKVIYKPDEMRKIKNKLDAILGKSQELDYRWIDDAGKMARDLVNFYMTFYEDERNDKKT